jgi:hypothetical protein
MEGERQVAQLVSKTGAGQTVGFDTSAFRHAGPPAFGELGAGCNPVVFGLRGFESLDLHAILDNYIGS